MQQLINELKAGTAIFTIQEDGTETVARYPPSALALRAAVRLETCLAVIQGLERNLETLAEQYRIAQEGWNNSLKVNTDSVADIAKSQHQC